MKRLEVSFDTLKACGEKPLYKKLGVLPKTGKEKLIAELVAGSKSVYQTCDTCRRSTSQYMKDNQFFCIECFSVFKLN